MRVLDVILALLAAFLVQTVLGRYFGVLNNYLDLFAVVAATFGLIRGRVAGMAVGTAAGLIQDAFSGGLLGLNGLSKTAVGYLAGIAGRHLIVRSWSSRLLFYAVVTLADLAILTGVGYLTELPRVAGEGWRSLYLCLGNAIAGILLIGAVDRKRQTDSM